MTTKGETPTKTTKIEAYKPFNMWNTQKMSHDTTISIGPSYCGKCYMSGSELTHFFCPKADPARLAMTLDEQFKERDAAVAEAVKKERERIVKELEALRDNNDDGMWSGRHGIDIAIDLLTNPKQPTT